MTDPKNPNRPGDGELPKDIEEVFRQWDARRSAPLDDTPDLLADYPLTEEELALDHEIAQTPEQMLNRARRAARYRLVFTLILTVAAAASLFVNRADLTYFAQNESDLVDAGDLRARWLSMICA